MEQIRQYQKYMLPLAVLVIIKFVFLPLWQLKEENYRQLAATNYNLEKTIALAGLSQQMHVRAEDMGALLAAAEQYLRQGAESTQLKLDAQAELESLLAKHQLTLSNSSWKEGLGNSEAKLFFYDCNFSGTLANYLQFISELSSSPLNKFYYIQDARLRISDQNAQTSGNVEATLSIGMAVSVGESS